MTSRVVRGWQLLMVEGREGDNVEEGFGNVIWKMLEFVVSWGLVRCRDGSDVLKAGRRGIW